MQVCRYVVLQCALCNGDVLVIGVQAGRLSESISGVVRLLGSKKKASAQVALWPGKKPCVAGLSVLLWATKHRQVRAARYC